MKLTNGLKIGAEILLGATLTTLLIASLRETVIDDYVGIGLLVPAAVFAIFMWLGWIKPSETGLALVLLGTIVIVFFGNIADSPITWPMIGGSTLVAGLLLLGAGWKFHQNHENEPRG